jgi:hypothetical protein
LPLPLPFWLSFLSEARNRASSPHDTMIIQPTRRISLH